MKTRGKKNFHNVTIVDKSPWTVQDDKDFYRGTLPGLIISHGITIHSVLVYENPNLFYDMPQGILHYKVTLRGHFSHTGPVRQMTTFYSQGPAHNDLPTPYAVLYSILSDASSSGQTFESFCREFGFDSDSIRAEKTWKAIDANTAKLRKFLGESYDHFMSVMANE